MECFNCGQPLNGSKTKCSTCGKPLHKDCANNCIKCGEILCDTCSLANQFKCKSCTEAVPKLDIPFVRRSHIELYKTCPYAFYLEVIKQIKTQNNVYAENGIFLHDMFDTHSKNPDNDPANLTQQYNTYFESTLLNHPDLHEKPELKDKIYNMGINSIKGYLAYEATASFPFATEETLFIIIDDNLPQIRVTIDRIEQGKTGLKIKDYKTGKLYVGTKLATDLQIPLYIKAVQDKYGQIVEEFELLFLAEGKTRKYVRVNDNTYVVTVGKKEYTVDIQERLRDVKTIFGRILQQQFSIPPTINEWYCTNFCYFGKTGTCAKGNQQRWIGTGV